MKNLANCCLITALALTLILTSGCLSPGGTVVSDDGQAELQIPPTALPYYMSLRDISVTRVHGDQSFIAYRLQPHGLRFAQPVTFTATYHSDTGAVPYVLHLSDDVSEVPANSKVEIDTASKQVTVSAQISHFSTIGVGTGYKTGTYENFFGTVFVAEAEIPPDTAVGSKIPYQATFKSTGQYWPDGGVVFADTIKLKGDLYVQDNPSVVSPSSESDRPPLTRIGSSDFSVRSQQLTCAKPGSAGIYHHFKVQFDYVAAYIKGYFGGITIDKVITVNQRVVLKTPVRCVAADAGSGVAHSDSADGQVVVGQDNTSEQDSTSSEQDSTSSEQDSTSSEQDTAGEQLEPQTEQQENPPVDDTSNECTASTAEPSADFSVCAGLEGNDCYNCCENNFYGSGLVSGCILENGC